MDKEIVFILNGILFSLKKEKNSAIWDNINWMNLEGIIISEINQTQKDKYCMITLICGI
jgi:hypothetical protein